MKVNVREFVKLEEVIQAWKNAEIRRERSGGSRCAICHKRIRPGTKVIVTEDARLVQLYGGRLYPIEAHQRCYQRLMKHGLGIENNGNKFTSRSLFRKYVLCPRCSLWMPKILALDYRCPYCGYSIRTLPRVKKGMKLAYIEPDVKVNHVKRIIRAQLTLDDYIAGRLAILKRRERIEVYKVE